MVIKDLELLTILQARMSSTRLPGKVMADLNGKPMILRQINRITQAQRVSKLVVATSTDPSDDVLEDFLVSEGIEVFRGELKNVFSRFFELILKYQPQNIVRLTADCPLVMPRLIDEMVAFFDRSEYDYLSNTLIRNYPDGLDIEIFRAQTLVMLKEVQMTSQEEEHVTSGIYSRPDKFQCGNFSNLTGQVHGRWTVDYQEDLEFVRKVYSEFIGREESFTFDEVMLALPRIGFIPK
jgi:spore coat polysaccharide biosynthesis protein SpsF